MSAGSSSAVPFHCPYCGETDLRPHAASHGAWECRACLRAFQVSMLGLVAPGGTTPPSGSAASAQEGPR